MKGYKAQRIVPKSIGYMIKNINNFTIFTSMHINIICIFIYTEHVRILIFNNFYFKCKNTPLKIMQKITEHYLVI